MKKPKLTDELLRTELPNYSPLLLQSFCKQGQDFIVHLYRLLGFERFAILLPVVMTPCPTHLVETPSPLMLTPDQLETLKAFQVALWSELFKVKQADGGSSDTCNYLVVPIKDGSIDYDLVSSALLPPVFPAEPLLGKFVHAMTRPKILWEVLQVVDKATPVVQFLSVLLGSKHPDLQSSCLKYADKTPFEIIQDASWTIQALSCFRTAIAEGKVELGETSTVLLVKQVHSARSNMKPKFKGAYPHGTPILHLDTVVMSYLDAQLVRESHKLPQALVDVEAFSYVCDFCNEFGFAGADYMPVYCALRSASLDPTHNYESLETLGDTVLKFLTSFHHFLIYAKDDEGWLTRKRTYIINNQFLTKVGCEQGIHKYLKSQPMGAWRWKPPYFRTSELAFKTTVHHRISDGMVADAVEALIGAYFVAKGLLHAVEFIDRIGLIKKGADWAAVKTYCDYNSFELLSPAKLGKVDLSKQVSLQELIPKPEAVLLTGSQQDNWGPLLKSLLYEVKRPELFREAFTHSSADSICNYERLEFLGDALIDLIVVANIYASSETSIHPHALTLMHQTLINNNTLAYFSISLQLHSYMASSSDLAAFIDGFMTDLKWEDDLLNFGVYSQDPPKYLADLFEALTAAILLDSGTVSLASRVVQLVMIKAVAYMSLHKDHCQSNIVTRAREFAQKQGLELAFRTVQAGEAVTVAALAGGRELSRHTAQTRWLAERYAANKAFHALNGLIK